MEDRIANINMTINNDDDFLSHFCAFFIIRYRIKYIVLDTGHKK